MLVAEVAAASEAVASTSGRRAKVELLAACLRAADDAELPVVVGWLAGFPRQRRTGIGWASLRDLPPPAEHAVLQVLELDAALEAAAGTTGAGSWRPVGRSSSACSPGPPPRSSASSPGCSPASCGRAPRPG